MAKQNLPRDSVLRRDYGSNLWLVPSLKSGWNYRIQVKDEETLLSIYNVELGKWSKDEYGEYCPIHPLYREEIETIPDIPKSIILHDGHNILRGFSLLGNLTKPNDNSSKEEVPTTLAMIDKKVVRQETDDEIRAREFFQIDEYSYIGRKS